ncbi:hypothetical protein CW304_11710 [Bacillus sp. UFRGS-B20]|nr:hypothetical protein CW304_11710 [Bacillus sp. UFRGS-B20]
MKYVNTNGYQLWDNMMISSNSSTIHHYGGWPLQGLYMAYRIGRSKSVLLNLSQRNRNKHRRIGPDLL